MAAHSDKLIKRISAQGKGAEADMKREYQDWAKHLRWPGSAVMHLLHAMFEQNNEMVRSDDIKLMFQHVFEKYHYNVETRLIRGQITDGSTIDNAAEQWARFWVFYSLPSHVLEGMLDEKRALAKMGPGTYSPSSSSTPPISSSVAYKVVGASLRGSPSDVAVMYDLEEKYGHAIATLQQSMQTHLYKVRECAAQVKSSILTQKCKNEIKQTATQVGQDLDNLLSKTDLISAEVTTSFFFSDTMTEHTEAMIDAAARFSQTGRRDEFELVGVDIEGEGGGSFLRQFSNLEHAAFLGKVGSAYLGMASDKLAQSFVADQMDPNANSAEQFSAHLMFHDQLMELCKGLRAQLDLLKNFGTAVATKLQHHQDMVHSQLLENAASIGATMDLIACATCGGGGGGEEKEEEVVESSMFDFDLSGLGIDAELIGRNWIHGAIKHPGSFRRAASSADQGKFKGKTSSFAHHVIANRDHKHGGATIQRRAQLALTLAKLRKHKK